MPSCAFRAMAQPAMQIIGPIDEGEFVAEDFTTLAEYEMSKRVGPVLRAYTNVTGHESESVG